MRGGAPPPYGEAAPPPYGEAAPPAAIRGGRTALVRGGRTGAAPAVPMPAPAQGPCRGLTEGLPTSGADRHPRHPGGGRAPWPATARRAAPLCVRRTTGRIPTDGYRPGVGQGGDSFAAPAARVAPAVVGLHAPPSQECRRRPREGVRVSPTAQRVGHLRRASRPSGAGSGRPVRPPGRGRPSRPARRRPPHPARCARAEEACSRRSDDHGCLRTRAGVCRYVRERRRPPQRIRPRRTAGPRSARGRSTTGPRRFATGPRPGPQPVRAGSAPAQEAPPPRNATERPGVPRRADGSCTRVISTSRYLPRRTRSRHSVRVT